jgi:hypothetical protein
VDTEPEIVGHVLQLLLPEAAAIPIAPARIGRDEQRRRLRIGAAPHHRPPLGAVIRGDEGEIDDPESSRIRDE